MISLNQRNELVVTWPLRQQKGRNHHYVVIYCASSDITLESLDFVVPPYCSHQLAPTSLCNKCSPGLN